MTKNTEAEMLFEKYSHHEVTVMFLPKNFFNDSSKVQWIGQETRTGLHAIINLIMSEQNNHAGYRLIIHEKGEDIFLDQPKIDELLYYTEELNRAEENQE